MDRIAEYKGLCLCSTGSNAVAQCSYSTIQVKVRVKVLLGGTAIAHHPDPSKGSDFGNTQPFFKKASTLRILFQVYGMWAWSSGWGAERMWDRGNLDIFRLRGKRKQIINGLDRRIHTPISYGTSTIVGAGMACLSRVHPGIARPIGMGNFSLL